jgi:deazaflavin-dependent oxidoreductase (nitroreductase family)
MSKFEIPDWINDHLRLYAEFPEKGHLWNATAGGGSAETTTLLLTTTGRKSGRQFTMPLIYGTDGDRQVIVASKGGAPKHPSWYLNLQAHPEVGVQVAARKFRAIARTTTGAERQRLWQLMAGILPLYNDYVKLTDRVIPVVVLEATGK